MKNKRYKILSHTADFKIRFYGKNFSELIDSIFQFYYENLKITKKYENFEEKIVEFEDESFEFIAVRLINELIFYKDINKFVEKYRIIEITNSILKIKLELREGIVSFVDELKSATYYNLKLRKEKEDLILEIVIDV